MGRYVLAGLWIAWALAMVAVFVLKTAFIVMLVGTILSIVTYRRLRDRTETGRLSMRWRIPYRIVVGSIVLAAGMGTGISARGAAFDARYGLNSVFAAMFLVTGVCGWRALVAPTARRVAGTPLVFHAAALIGSAVIEQYDLQGRWGSWAPFYALGALMVTSGIAGALAVIAFGGEAELPVARAAR